MWFHVPAVLTASECEEIRALLQSGEYVDGRLSAGAPASEVKHNEELKEPRRSVEEAERKVAQAVQRHPQITRQALPLRISHPIFARYRAGMDYGWHSDDAVMGQGGYRADIAMTVFLNDPSEYDGGDLVVQTPYGECQAKHAAGDAVLYSASRLHRVEAIRSGERLVAVLWIQSQVRDEQQREVLQRLDELCDQKASAEEVTQLGFIYARLLRMWADV